MPSLNAPVIGVDPANIKTYRDLLVDTAMGQYLRLGGTITCTGIQAPIAVGDALEYAEVVFLIEGVAHACNISADGRPNFTTTLTVALGLALAASNELNMYPAMTAIVRTNVSSESIYPTQIERGERSDTKAEVDVDLSGTA
jgi:hypothetical protein